MAFNITLGFPNSAGGGPISGVVVHRYQLRDALSELFELSLEIASTDLTLDFHGVVGEALIVAFPDDPTQPPIEGIVKSVQQLSSTVASLQSQAASGYKIVVVPPIWLTTRRRDHRLFENKSAADIVAAVLASYGGRIPAPTLRLARPAPVREYVVQYGESDWEFIARILATDFITSFFDHGSASAFTLIDDTSKITSSPAAATPFLPPSNLTAPGPHVFNVHLASNIETSVTTLRDYDFERPNLELAGAQTAKPADGLFRQEANLEAYAFDIDEFNDGPGGDARAGHFLEALRARSRTITLEANFNVGPGNQIAITGHPRTDINASFLVVGTRVVLDDGGTRGLLPSPPPTATFVLECIPSAVPFLPLPRPKPRIHGTQTGTIVGGADGDVVADSKSRVHVLFKWDRQKQASKKTRPVRVSQAWAGTAYGFFALPRVGDEVVVAYLDGDPDEADGRGPRSQRRAREPRRSRGAGEDHQQMALADRGRSLGIQRDLDGRPSGEGAHGATFPARFQVHRGARRRHVHQTRRRAHGRLQQDGQDQEGLFDVGRQRHDRVRALYACRRRPSKRRPLGRWNDDRRPRCRFNCSIPRTTCTAKLPQRRLWARMQHSTSRAPARSRMGRRGDQHRRTPRSTSLAGTVNINGQAGKGDPIKLN